MRLLALLLLGVSISACSEGAPELPKATSPDRLLDCTAGFLAWQDDRRKNDPFREMRVQQNYLATELSRDEKSTLLDTATNWAHANSYLPCHYQMCAALLSGRDDTINVHILSEIHIEGWIAPNAELWVSADDGTIVEERPFHTGCAHRARMGINR